LVYDLDNDAAQKAEQMAKEYFAGLQQLPADKLEAKKDEIKHMRDVANYLVRCNIVQSDSELKAQLEQIIKDHKWDEKKKK
jgi:hypothetical protein